jgi:hypothetical protein
VYVLGSIEVINLILKTVKVIIKDNFDRFLYFILLCNKNYHERAPPSVNSKNELIGGNKNAIRSR